MSAGQLFPAREVVFSLERTCRRALRAAWVEHPTRWAAWMMLNPSDADAMRDDPTTHRVTHFSKAWGYDGWVIVNCYPFIASQPSDMWERVAGARADTYEDRDALHRNLTDIEAAGRAAAVRIVAFGNGPARDETWLEMCLEAFRQPSDVGADDHLVCLGTTKAGWPLHPLARGRHRVPNTQQPVPWSRP